MDFKTLLAAMASMGGDERPEDMLDQLDASYDADMGSATARIDESSTRTLELEQEISRLKSHNYDLMMQTRAESVEDDPEAEADGDESDSDNDESNPDIDDLFEDKE